MRGVPGRLTCNAVSKASLSSFRKAKGAEKAYRQREWRTYDGNFVPPDLSYQVDADPADPIRLFARAEFPTLARRCVLPQDIPPNLAIGPYPQCEEDVILMKERGITGVINVQTDDDHRFRMINWELMEGFYKEHGISVKRIPIMDFNGERDHPRSGQALSGSGVPCKIAEGAASAKRGCGRRRVGAAGEGGSGGRAQSGPGGGGQESSSAGLHSLHSRNGTCACCGVRVFGTPQGLQTQRRSGPLQASPQRLRPELVCDGERPPLRMMLLIECEERPARSWGGREVIVEIQFSCWATRNLAYWVGRNETTSSARRCSARLS